MPRIDGMGLLEQWRGLPVVNLVMLAVWVQVQYPVLKYIKYINTKQLKLPEARILLITLCLLIFIDVKGQKHRMVFLLFHPEDGDLGYFFGLKLGEIGLDFL